jgi:hypothetical protein
MKPLNRMGPAINQGITGNLPFVRISEHNSIS